MATPLEQQYLALQQRLAGGTPGVADINAATDFAIDANTAGRADLTLSILEPLSRAAPETAKIWQLLGLAWRDEQDMEKAAMAFDRAAALAPQDARIAMGKAQVAFETGRPAAALFQAVRTVAPHDGELALSTAAALAHQGDASSGEQVIEALLVENPGWLRGLDALATMRWMTGDTQDFDCSFASAVKSQPQDMALRLGWYRAVSQVGQWEKASTIIASARHDFGPRIELDAIAANAATEMGEDTQAQALFAKVMTLDDPGTKISFVRHCLRTGQLQPAEATCLSLIQTPAAPSAWPYLSTIWRLKSDPRSGWLDGDPPHIAHYDLPIGPNVLDALAQRLRELHLTTQHPPEQSLRGGTQTQGHLFLRLDPEIITIKSMILDAVRDYVDALPPVVPGHPLLGTPRNILLYQGAWSVRLNSQGFHVVHTHPMGWISSAFYVDIPSHMGSEHAGWLQLGAPPPDLRLDLAPYQMIEPKPGRLALFPSTMWHGTVPFDDGERLTIAFDMRAPSR